MIQLKGPIGSRTAASAFFPGMERPSSTSSAAVFRDFASFFSLSFTDAPNIVEIIAS